MRIGGKSPGFNIDGKAQIVYGDPNIRVGLTRDELTHDASRGAAFDSDDADKAPPHRAGVNQTAGTTCDNIGIRANSPKVQLLLTKLGYDPLGLGVHNEHLIVRSQILRRTELILASLRNNPKHQPRVQSTGRYPAPHMPARNMHSGRPQWHLSSPSYSHRNAPWKKPGLADLAVLTREAFEEQGLHFRRKAIEIPGVSVVLLTGIHVLIWSNLRESRFA